MLTLGDIKAQVVRGDAAQPAPTGHLDHTDQDHLVKWAERERVTPLLAQWNDQTTLLNCPEAAAKLERNRLNGDLWRLRLEKTLGQVAATLEAAGVDFTLTKGMAAAHTIYPNPALRQTADLDLVVRDHQFHLAADVLQAGLAATPRPKTPRQIQRVPVPHTGRPLLIDKVEIDLHRRVDPKVGRASINPSCYFDTGLTKTVSIGDSPIRVPGPELLMVHAACHLASINTRLSTMADIYQLSHHPELDVHLLWALADREHLIGILQWAFDRTGELAGIRPRLYEPEGTAQGPTAVERLLLSHRDLGFLVWLVHQHGPASIPPIMLDMIWPKRDFLDAHGIRRTDSLRRAARGLRRTLQPRRATIRAGEGQARK